MHWMCLTVQNTDFHLKNGEKNCQVRNGNEHHLTGRVHQTRNIVYDLFIQLILPRPRGLWSAGSRQPRDRRRREIYCPNRLVDFEVDRTSSRWLHVGIERLFYFWKFFVKRNFELISVKSHRGDLDGIKSPRWDLILNWRASFENSKFEIWWNFSSN